MLCQPAPLADLLRHVLSVHLPNYRRHFNQRSITHVLYVFPQLRHCLEVRRLETGLGQEHNICVGTILEPRQYAMLDVGGSGYLRASKGLCC